MQVPARYCIITSLDFDGVSDSWLQTSQVAWERGPSPALGFENWGPLLQDGCALVSPVARCVTFLLVLCGQRKSGFGSGGFTFCVLPPLGR